MTRNDLNGKVVLIAGGAKNLGGLLSRDFAKKGAKLAIHFNSETTKSDVEKLLINELPFNSCAVMWHRACFEGNRFEEHLMYAEEWELYSRILSSDIKGISIEKCLFFGRKHANSNTGEFYSNNPIRRASKKEAILLVIKNLKEKQLLSPSLLRYFVTQAADFKEYNLFTQIITLLELSIFERIKWQFFYSTFPLRLSVYKLKKVVQKI